MYIMGFQISMVSLLGVSSSYLDGDTSFLAGAHKTGTVPLALCIWSSIVFPLGAFHMALILGNVMTMVQR